jgi:hypothetical protein
VATTAVAEVERDDEDTGEEGQERARRRLRDERRVWLRRGGGRSCSMGVRTRMARMGAGPGGGVEGAGGDDGGRGGGVGGRGGSMTGEATDGAGAAETAGLLGSGAAAAAAGVLGAGK